MSIIEDVKINLEKLKKNSYPGRGIIIGKTPTTNKVVQVYWIMGRSEGSRNRYFEIEDNKFVKTKIFDESKINKEDLSLIVYHPVKYFNNYHIVSNGDQTDTIYYNLKNGKTFEDSIDERKYEHDKPNYTPRISGIVNLTDKFYKYKLSIIKTIDNNPEVFQRNYFNYINFMNGFGYCITTYKNDGNPIPSFEGEPFIVEIFDDIDETLNYYWELLNSENKVSILVKYFNSINNIDIKIKNKNISKI